MTTRRRDMRPMLDDRQTSAAVMMVRPAAFGFHAEAAASNAFAAWSADTDVADRARREFDGVAAALERHGVAVLLLPDRPEPPRPDAVFPNNWISFHADGTVILYPMATEARRLERDLDAVRRMANQAGLAITRVIDLSAHEQDARHLEGTGSLILDREHGRAFASLSDRTHRDLVADFDRATGYATSTFAAHDRHGAAIYHTNVLLSLGRSFALLCTEAIAEADRASVVAAIEESGRTLVDVSYDQMDRFACNILELDSRAGPVIAMSTRAMESFSPEQRRQLEGFGSLVSAPIPTIEAVGGGSVRCMIAEVFLPRA